MFDAQRNLDHASQPCTDPDCEIHHPEVIEEYAQRKTAQAWFTAGQRIPFGLTPAELVLEPGTEDADWATEKEWVSDYLEEHEAERVFHAAALLQQANPSASFAACLRTAVIWERG